MASGSPRKVKANLAGLEIIELILKKKNLKSPFGDQLRNTSRQLVNFIRQKLKGLQRDENKFKHFHEFFNFF